VFLDHGFQPTVIQERSETWQYVFSNAILSARPNMVQRKKRFYIEKPTFSASSIRDLSLKSQLQAIDCFDSVA